MRLSDTICSCVESNSARRQSGLIAQGDDSIEEEMHGCISSLRQDKEKMILISQVQTNYSKILRVALIALHRTELRGYLDCWLR